MKNQPELSLPVTKVKRPPSPRKANSANAFFEIAGTFVPANQAYGINTISIKTMQMLVSGYTIFYLDSSWPEKMLHLAQAGLACSLVALNIVIYLRNDECLQIATNFCQAALICESLYKGLMLTGMGATEVAKKYYEYTGSPATSPRKSDDDTDESHPEIIVTSI